MKHLSKEQIMCLHSMAIKKTGGLDGIRDEDIIDLGLGIASGKYNDEYIAEWILSFSG